MVNNEEQNSNLYRLSETSIQHVRSLSGTARCTGCLHSANVQASWKGNASSDGGASIKNFNPNTTNLNISSSSIILDPFACLEQDSQCTPMTTEDVDCSEAGTLESYNGSSNLPKVQEMNASANWITGPPQNQNGDYVYTGIVEICPPGSATPGIIMTNSEWAGTDNSYANTPNVVNSTSQYDESWNVEALGYSLDGGQTWSFPLISNYWVNMPIFPWLSDVTAVFTKQRPNTDPSVECSAGLQ